MMRGRVFLTELAKLRRSRITWITFLAYGIFPIIGGLFMYIMKNPEGARRLGLLGQKASLTMGSADWPGFLSFMSTMSAVGGMLIISVIVSYLFGREYVENTAKNMLALPIRRERFVVSKLCVALVWFAALTVWFCVEGLAVGWLLGLSGWSWQALTHEVGIIFTTAGLLFMLSPLTGWIAQASKGYMAPLGFTMGTLVLSAFLGHTGWGQWFPWTIVPMIAGLAGPQADAIPTASYIVVAVTCVVGLAVALLHVRMADNTQ
jgi:ABC-type transport system involved in multi-copper enzyme maturation permease subunit